MVVTKQMKADLMLLLVTLCWGSSYLFMRLGLNTLQEFNLIALRFGIAFLLAAMVFFRRLKSLDFKSIRNGFILGTILFSAFVFIIFGVKSTTISNAGFLMSLTVIFVPVLSAVLFYKIPPPRVLFGICLAIIGIGLLTLNNQLTVSMGDFFCILGAFIFAIHIIVTGQLIKQTDSITLGMLQLGFAGALGLVFSLITETPKLPATVESWVSVLALSVVCSAIGFITQTAAQKHTTPTHTGLIFSLEPVVSTVFAIAFAGETLSIRGYIGAAIVLAGVLNAEVNLKKLFSRNTLEQSNC